MWCAGFVPEYKQLVAPVEKLLSPAGEGRWTQECTDACNRLVAVIFRHITLHSTDPSLPLRCYPQV